MAKIAQCFADNRGTFHSTPEQAVLSDLAAVLGRINGDTGLAGGIASVILDKRAEIEAAFRDLDQMTKKAAPPRPLKRESEAA